MDTRLGGWKAGCMFGVTLAGYVVQTQFTQHVQGDLQYRQPVFIFWLSHSSFFVIFPLHLAILSWWTNVPARAYIAGLKDAIQERLSPSTPSIERGVQFPTARFLRIVFLLTAGITSPGLLWYIAVSLTPISDVTAILNTNAFWAYLLSEWMASTPWQAKRLWAVLIAVFGVFVIVYGGASREPSNPDDHSNASAELVGDALTLLASILYAVYQTTYKRYVALPNRIEHDENKTNPQGYEPLPNGSQLAPGIVSPRRRRALSIGSEPARTSWNDEDEEADSANNAATVYPAFGLHPNFITSCIGLTTLLFLWPLVVILHYTGIETFRLPDNMETWYSILAVSICGVAYNVGFMILLSLWGPTLATVGNLLTIVLVLISDSIFGHGLETLTVSSLSGATAIITAFGVLVIEERNAERERTRQRIVLSSPAATTLLPGPQEQ